MEDIDWLRTAAADAEKWGRESEAAKQDSEQHSDSLVTPSYTPGALAALLGVSDKTINRHAKAAGVATPESGQKAKPYSLPDVCRILSQFVAKSPRDAAKAAELLNKITPAIPDNSRTSPTIAGQSVRG